MTAPQQPPRLALIANRFQKNDGQGRVNYEVARELLRRSWPLTLITAHCAEEIAQDPNVHVVYVGAESLPTQLLKDWAFANGSARWLRKHRHSFDLVQGNGFVTWEPCDILTAHFVHAAWARSKFFPYARSWRPYSLYQRLFTSLNSVWEKKVFRAARHIIAVSEVVAEDLSQLGISRERIDVIYNGVDLEEFRPGKAERESFGLPLDLPLGLFVGDIQSPRKNLATLLQAMTHAPGFHLAVAGDAAGSPAPDLAKKLGIADRVYFLGKTSRVAALMRSVDVFVFPSRYEAHPLVILEAMASGLPIIVSRNVGSVKTFREYMKVVDDPDDVASLAEAIVELIAAPELRQKMAGMARERALQMSWEKTTQRYIDVYMSQARAQHHEL